MSCWTQKGSSVVVGMVDRNAPTNMTFAERNRPWNWIEIHEVRDSCLPEAWTASGHSIGRLHRSGAATYLLAAGYHFCRRDQPLAAAETGMNFRCLTRADQPLKVSFCL